MSSCEVAAEALSYQSQFFFHDIPKLSHIQSTVYTYGLSTDYGAYKAQGIPTVKVFPDKEGGRVLWITLREESY